MWRDLARICAAQDLPLKLPPVALSAERTEGRAHCPGAGRCWRLAAFTRAVYTANFAKQKDIADDEVLRDILSGLGHDADAAFAAANAPDNKARLKAQTDEAHGARHLRRAQLHRRRRTVLGQ